MIDLHEIIKRRQDELRSREEDWIDRLFCWWRGVDGWWLLLVIVAVPHVAVMFAIEIAFLWQCLK